MCLGQFLGAIVENFYGHEDTKNSLEKVFEIIIPDWNIQVLFQSKEVKTGFVKCDENIFFVFISICFAVSVKGS